MKSVFKWSAGVLLAVMATLSADLVAHTNSSIISRLLVSFPDLGYQGGAGLHASVTALVNKIGNNMDSRYEEFTAQADSTTLTHEHNFNVPFANLMIQLWSGTGSSKTLIADPAGAGWVIAATSGFVKTKIDITTPSSGGPHSFSVEVKSGFGNMAKQAPSAVAITGGSVAGVTLSVDDTDSAFNLGIVSTSTLTSGKTLTLDLNDGNRTLEMSGNLIKSGSSPLTLVTTGTTSATFPAGTISIVSTDTTQALTNKDIDGGTASNTNRITLPSNTSSNLTALTRKAGTVVYDTTAQKPYFDNGTALVPVGSGAGGELNLVTSPSDALNWSETGSVFATPVTTRTSGDQPLLSTVGSAIQFVATGNGTEATHYNSFTFTTDEAMSGFIKASFYIRPGTGFASNEWTVSVYDNSNARIPLSTDVPAISGTTYLTNDSIAVDTRFSILKNTTYTLRFARVAGSGSATLNVSNVIVGPGAAANKGAVVTASESWIPTGSLTTNVTYAGKKWKDGDRGYYEVEITFTGVNTQGNVSVNMPTGETIDLNKRASTVTTSSTNIGDTIILDISGSTYRGSTALKDSTSVYALVQESTGSVDIRNNTANTSVPRPAALTSFQSGDKIDMRWDVPIVEFSQNVVILPSTSNQFVSVLGKTTNSPVFSASGTIIGDTLTKNIGNAYSASTGVFTVPTGGTGTYSFDFHGLYSISSFSSSGLSHLALTQAGSQSRNYAGDINSITATGNYPLTAYGQVYAAAGDTLTFTLNKSSGTYSGTVTNDSSSYFSITRLTDENNQPIIGVPYASQGIGGLVKGAGQLIGTNTNDSADSDKVGYLVSATSSTITAQSNPGLGIFYAISGASLTLTAGDWDVWAQTSMQEGTATSGTILLLRSRLYNSSDDLALALQTASSTNIANGFSVFSLRAPISIAFGATKIVRVDFGIAPISGTPATTYLEAAVGFTTIWARRAR